MILNASTLVSLGAVVFYGALLYIVLRRDMRSGVYRSFAVYLLAMLIWSIGSFMMFAHLAGDTLFWNRFLIVGSAGMPIAFFSFVRVFLRKRHWPWLQFGLLTYALTQVANALGYVVERAYVSEGMVYNEYGPGINLAMVCWAIFISLSALDLTLAYRKTKDPSFRNRIRYLLLVVIVIFGGSLTNVTGLEIYPVDIAFNGLAALLTLYAIYRHQLLDISVVIRKGLLYSIPTAIIGAIYFVIISLMMKLFHALTGMQVFLLSLAVGLIAAAAAEPLRHRAQLWVDRLFFRERHDASLMLERLSRTVASLLDLDRLANMILDEVATTMHISKAAFLVRREPDDNLHLIAQRGLDLEQGFSLRRDHPVVSWLSAHERILTAHEMDVLPQFKSLWEQEREVLDRLEAELFIPLAAKRELVGVFVVGPKLSEEPYTPDDQVTLTTLASQAAVAIENARLYQAIQQELAERKRAEEEREKMQDQLLLAQKMEAVGRLAGGVAHDFNNLLTAITSYSEFLIRSFERDDPRRADAEEIRKVAERAATLTRQLLAFSRRQTLQPQAVSLNDVVSGLQKMLRRLIGEDIELITVLGPGLRETKADAGQIEQVILNLVVNARDAMPEGGRLTIRTENVSLDESQCRLIPDARPGQFVRLSVEDTGVGMAEEVIQHIFEPFFTTKEVGKGTGLGLAVAYGIVQQHAGWINVSSESGRGARFSVYLPSIAPQVTPQAHMEEPPVLASPGGSGSRILLVEDEEEVRAVTRRTLEENGYAVFEAANAIQAMSIFDREEGVFDLLVSDVVLPGKSGVQLAEELIARTPSLRILLTSGYAGERSRWASIQEKGFRFLQKPYAAPELLRAVREALDGE